MFTVSVALKEFGGIALNPYRKPVRITKGQHFVLAIFFSDEAGRPITITAYNFKLRLKKADGSILVLNAVPYDNSKGESEVVLSAANSDLLLSALNQSVEIECFQVSAPTVKSYYTAINVLSVLDQLMV